MGDARRFRESESECERGLRQHHDAESARYQAAALRWRYVDVGPACGGGGGAGAVAEGVGGGRRGGSGSGVERGRHRGWGAVRAHLQPASGDGLEDGGGTVELHDSGGGGGEPGVVRGAAAAWRREAGGAGGEAPHRLRRGAGVPAQRAAGHQRGRHPQRHVPHLAGQRPPRPHPRLHDPPQLQRRLPPLAPGVLRLLCRAAFLLQRRLHHPRPRPGSAPPPPGRPPLSIPGPQNGSARPRLAALPRYPAGSWHQRWSERIQHRNMRGHILAGHRIAGTPGLHPHRLNTHSSAQVWWRRRPSGCRRRYSEGQACNEVVAIGCTLCGDIRRNAGARRGDDYQPSSLRDWDASAGNSCNLLLHGVLLFLSVGGPVLAVGPDTHRICNFLCYPGFGVLSDRPASRSEGDLEVWQSLPHSLLFGGGHGHQCCPYGLFRFLGYMGADSTGLLHGFPIALLTVHHQHQCLPGPTFHPLPCQFIEYIQFFQRRARKTSKEVADFSGRGS